LARAFTSLRDHFFLASRLAESVSMFNRRRKLQIFNHLVKPSDKLHVLDVGVLGGSGREAENFLEKNYPFTSKIVGLGIEDLTTFKTEFKDITAVQYDGTDFPFKDCSFDVCWSNAVVEHVGNRNAQVRFLKEIYRVSRLGIVTTPNRYFPIEVHTLLPFVHFLPAAGFNFVLKALSSTWKVGQNLTLLSVRDIRSILAEAEISDFRIYKNRVAGLTLDFVIVFTPPPPADL
jgi:SAM-dependent methyltransferase